MGKVNLREKLENALRLERKVQQEAKPIYEEWHNATAEVIPLMINAINKSLAKKGESISGLITGRYSIKFSDGVSFELVPEYMTKEGTFRNCVFKAVGPEVFTIKKIAKDGKNGKESQS